MKADRIACCVPFCRRTRGIRKGETELPPEWICGRHWSAVPKRIKRRQRLSAKFIHREIRREPGASEYWKLPPGSRARIKAFHMWRVHESVWERCKRAAIESAGGIA